MKGQFSIKLVFCVISVSLAKPPPTFLEYKDSLGQYSFGYSAPGSARSEVRSIDGSTRGSYSYVDDSGIIQTAQYIADGEHGFRVTATNLPQAPKPVEDTPEVVAARIDHFKALEAASKLAEDDMGDDGLRTAIDAGKSMDSIVIDNDVELAEDKMDIQSKSVESSEPLIRRNSEETHSVNASEAKGTITKSAEVENQGATVKILEKADEDRSNEPIQSQAKSAAGHSDIPMMTTSFVIPDSVNLNTRIELDQSDVGGTRISPESSPFFVAQPSLSQEQEAILDPSMLTPAGTEIMTTNESEKSELLDRMSPVPASPLISTTNNEPQQYSSTIIPGVIAPSNAFALAYRVGVNPIYHHYNPYQYFPYGIL